MNSNPPQPQKGIVVDIPPSDRRSVYRRLQELEIPCSYQSHQPLHVELNHPTAEIQLWSVLQQLQASRKELIDWLNACWLLPVSPNSSTQIRKKN